MIDEKKKFYKNLIISVLVILALLLIPTFMGISFLANKGVVESKPPTIKNEKNITVQGENYLLKRPLLNDMSIYEVGEDIEVGIYDVYFYGDTFPGSNYITLDQSTKGRLFGSLGYDILDQYLSNVQLGTDFQIDDDRVVYKGLELKDGDILHTMISTGNSFMLKSVESIGKLDSSKSGMYTVQSGVYEIKLQDADAIYEELEVVSQIDKYILKYSLRNNFGELVIDLKVYDTEKEREYIVEMDKYKKGEVYKIFITDMNRILYKNEVQSNSGNYNYPIKLESKSKIKTDKKTVEKLIKQLGIE